MSYNTLLLFLCLSINLACSEGQIDSNQHKQDVPIEISDVRDTGLDRVVNRGLSFDECIQRLATVRGVSIEQGTEKAIVEYESLLKSGCGISEVRLALGLALAKVGRYDAAAQQYRIVVETEPKNWAAHWTLAQTLVLHLEMYDEGIIEIEKSRKLDDLGKNGHLYDYFLAIAYEGLGQHERALSHYRVFAIEQKKINSRDERLLEVLDRIKSIENTKP